MKRSGGHGEDGGQQTQQRESTDRERGRGAEGKCAEGQGGAGRGSPPVEGRRFATQRHAGELGSAVLLQWDGSSACSLPSFLPSCRTRRMTRR